MSPGDYKDTFVKAGDSETRKGLAEKKQQETPRLGCCWLTGKSVKRGPWRQVQGVRLG